MPQDPIQTRLDSIEKTLQEQAAVQNFIHGSLTTLTQLKETETRGIRKDVDAIEADIKTLVRRTGSLEMGLAELRRDIYGPSDDSEGPQSLFGLISRMERSIATLSDTQNAQIRMVEARVKRNEDQLALYAQRIQLILGYGTWAWNTFLNAWWKRVAVGAVIFSLLAVDDRTIVHDFISTLLEAIEVSSGG